MSTTPQDQASKREGRILLAIKAYQDGQIKSIRAAARAYDLPHNTLLYRLHGHPTRENSQLSNRKLTSTEEESLVQWINSMDERGQPPRIASVRDMANLLLISRTESAESAPLTVGDCWVRRFIQRHPNLKTKFSRKYDHQRALCEDSEIIRGWFQLVDNTIKKYGILSEDIYNFDETGFQMGVISTAKVVTGAERAGRAPLVQPGNREWVTVIEAVNATGWALSPMIILKGKMHQASWYENLPPSWVIGVSDNGWTTDQLGLMWLKEVFNKQTQTHTVGRYRLLILDGHGSHATAEFDQFCMQNSIIALYMPPHSSHLLQPLDVSCFSPLKKAYGRRVETSMRLGINHIDKDEFLVIYVRARMEALKDTSIRNGFKATGLVPYNPDEVLTRLHAQLHTPTPPSTAHGSQSSWTPKTPRNIAQLERQTKKLKQYMKHHTQSPPSSTDETLNQLVKGCQLAMHSAAILTKENMALRAANEKQKRKREKGRVYIAQEGILTAEEGLARAQDVDKFPTREVENLGSQVKKRAPARCSKCGNTGHTARTCS
jgi:hypothetical protein